jgi:hypothetical protein
VGRTPKILITFTLVFVALFSVKPGTVYACSCASPRTALEALAGADAVFLGRVVSITDNAKAPSKPAGIDTTAKEVVFEVLTTWKGEPTARRIIHVGDAKENMCAPGYAMGDLVLVYAHLWQGDILTTSICSGPLVKSAGIEELGYRMPPIEPSRVIQEWSNEMPRVEGPSEPPPTLAIMIGVPAAVLLALAANYFVQQRRSGSSGA